jgi:hypothetical protein
MSLVIERSAVRRMLAMPKALRESLRRRLDAIAADPFNIELNDGPYHEGGKDHFKVRQGKWRGHLQDRSQSARSESPNSGHKGECVPMIEVLEKSDNVVVLSRDSYELLLDALEDARDARALAELRLREAAGKAEYVPIEIVDRIAAGEHPVRVWREYRKLALGELVKRADVAQSYLSEIEAGKKPGSARALAAIAKALRVDIEDLLIPEQED